jgi:hypothetical protein
MSSGSVATTALLSGAFAALVAVAVTRAIELFGGQLGGLIATMPTTIVPASYGIAALAGLPLVGAAPPEARPQLVVASLFAFPAGALVSSGFLAVWRYLPPHLPRDWPLRLALPVMVVASLGTWATCAAASVALGRAVAAPQAYGLACFTLQGLVGLAATARHKAAPRGAAAVPLSALLLRGGLAGASICVAVVLTAAAGDGGVAAGMAAAFPVVFLTIQVSLWLGSDGRAVQGGAVGPMMLGHLAVPSFAMLFAVTAPQWGILPAMGVAWVAAVVLVSLPALVWLRWRAAIASEEEASASPSSSSAAAAAAPAVQEAEAAAAAAAAEPGLLAAPVGAAAKDEGWDEGRLIDVTATK